MKKTVISTILVLSGSFAVIGCTEASAVSQSQTSPATKMYQQNPSQHQKGDHMMGHHKGMGGGMGRGIEKLNLSEQQKAQLQALREVNKEQHEANRQQKLAQMQQFEAQTQALVNNPNLDMTALNRLADQQAAVSKQKFIERVQLQHAMAQVLTSEQKAELQKMHTQHQAKFKSKMKDRADKSIASVQ
ncbi:Spy/CpxP family protein refolding chaperone [Psychrobacter sp.]|uniref:Spy/CpxP family protein refolding chaperone n=1 Tax=Psychrobacter sp. TaxID=56811 RepID=UPI0025D5B7A7|nr:Spy/CpxP family protein refolding chaperone [Psychrobacter sp.]